MRRVVWKRDLLSTVSKNCNNGLLLTLAVFGQMVWHVDQQRQSTNHKTLLNSTSSANRQTDKQAGLPYSSSTPTQHFSPPLVEKDKRDESKWQTLQTEPHTASFLPFFFAVFYNERGPAFNSPANVV